MSGEFDEGYQEWTDELLEEADSYVYGQDSISSVNEPSFDFFELNAPIHQPKSLIGQYVAEQGIAVPLISSQAEWEQAFDNDEAMLRSEMAQDYSGLSGLLPSEVINKDEYNYNPNEFARDFGSLLLRGLRSGELEPTYYMQHFRGYTSWSEILPMLVSDARNFGIDLSIESHDVSASKWRYVMGSNVTIFADPNVEGRYHFGVMPAPGPNAFSKRHNEPIGGYQVEPGEYDKPQNFRKHTQPFVGRPFIEIYDQVQALPYFDNTQNPVLELQQDSDGVVHFLQYLKTGLKRDFVAPFDLPKGEDVVLTSNVRGITGEEGKQMRLYLSPDKMVNGMRGEGIFCDLIRPRSFQVQLLSRQAGFILHEIYVSFKDNHFDSSPMYRPPVAAGLGDAYRFTTKSLMSRLQKIIESLRSFENYQTVDYVDIKLTSNGREAAIESDWNIKTIAYEDIK